MGLTGFRVRKTFNRPLLKLVFLHFPAGGQREAVDESHTLGNLIPGDLSPAEIFHVALGDFGIRLPGSGLWSLVYGLWFLVFALPPSAFRVPPSAFEGEYHRGTSRILSGRPSMG